MKILITGTTGESMPPPYAGIPKVSLLYGRAWKSLGEEVAATFVYRPPNSDDLGANLTYFFEYENKPSKIKKGIFLLKYFFSSPLLYAKLFRAYTQIHPRISLEALLYSAYGVFIDKVVEDFKPDVILSEAALVKTFMVGQIAKMRRVPLVVDTYAEVRDPLMGVNKHLTLLGRKKYWEEYLQLPQLILGIDNCTDGPLWYAPKEKVKTFYDTCDFTLSKKEFADSKESMRSSFGIPNDAFVVGAVGAFEFRKGHDYLIQAISLLSKQGHNVHAAICGGGDPKKWKTLAKEYGVEDRVHFFQRLSEIDLIRFHRSLDLYSNLSNTPRSCGLDLALLEAMASSLPIIVSDTGALPSAVASQNGVVVPADNAEATEEAILGLTKISKEELLEMGKRSSEVAEKFDINRTSKIKLGWLEEVVMNYRK